MRHAIEHGGRDELAAVIEAIRATGALDYARAQARRGGARRVRRARAPAAIQRTAIICYNWPTSR